MSSADILSILAVAPILSIVIFNAGFVEAFNVLEKRKP